jgi:hypothetical protein
MTHRAREILAEESTTLEKLAASGHGMGWGISDRRRGNRK